MKRTFYTAQILTALACCLGTTSLSAQELPAVSAVNGKLDYAGGSMNSAEGHNFSGSISLPIGERFGFQADGLYSRIDDLDFYGGAGHLFWRNPDIGLIGLSGGYLQREDVDTFQFGAEGEYYLDRFTFGFFAGVGSIKYDFSTPFIDTEPTDFIGKFSVGYYIIDDLMVRASYATMFENNLGKAELEYQTPLSGLAFTAEGAIGDNDYDHWLVGIRYYFGGKKTLRERHRQDDPPGMMQQILHGLGIYGAEMNRKAVESWFPGTLPSWGSGGYYGSVFTTMGPLPGFIGEPFLNP